MAERYKGRIAEGMQVRSSDGEKIGKVATCEPEGFVVERGFPFAKDLFIPYDRVTSLGTGEVQVSLVRARAGAGEVAEEAKGAARSGSEAVSGSAREVSAAISEPRPRGSLAEFGKPSELRVPLVGEEIVTHKRVERIGEVHVRKEVFTEEKQITVPVTREVIRVERVSVNREVGTGARIFEKESYDIPISEEHVTVEKRPVVVEELRVGKEIQQGEETASATVRRERAEVEMAGPIRRAEGTATEPIPIRAQAAGGSRR